MSEVTLSGVAVGHAFRLSRARNLICKHLYYIDLVSIKINTLLLNITNQVRSVKYISLNRVYNLQVLRNGTRPWPLSHCRGCQRVCFRVSCFGFRILYFVFRVSGVGFR